MLCAQLNPISHHFMQICVPPNIDLICGLILIFNFGLLLVSGNTDYLYMLQTKVRQYGPVKTSNSPKFDYS